LDPRTANPVLRLGETARYTVTVTDIGDGSLRLDGDEVFGRDVGGHSNFGDSCLGRTLAPRETCSYELTLTPIVAGRISGTFCVTGVTQDSGVADRECGPIHGVAL
jgi:hypothetical protein